MSRRTSGAVLIAAVLLGAVISSSVRPRLVGGSAEAVPVAAAPAVGSCLRQPVVVDAETSQANEPVFPSVAIGPCSGRHFGEVVAVVEHHLEVPASASSVFDPYQRRCATALTAWTGDEPDELGNRRWMLEYQFATSVSVAFAGPDRRQRAAGQSWVACIAVPQAAVTAGATSRSYLGSIRGGFTHRPAPPGLSVCWTQAHDNYNNAATADCTAAHRVEILGHRYLDSTAGVSGSTADDQRACRQFAAQATGMTDPTGGGRLTIDVRATAVVGADPSLAVDAWCVVTPRASSEQLFGPLLGLGNAPLPLH